MKIIILVLVIAELAFLVLVYWLATYQEPPVPERSRIIAKANLQPLTLVNAANLEPRPDAEHGPDISKLSNRYLLVGVDEGKEVREEMLAPPAATVLLSDAVAVSVPASPTTVVGNQLRTGDLVDVVAVSSKIDKFEVMVLSPPTKDSSMIVLAVPSARRDDFATALVGTQLLISRKIVATKP